MKDVVISVLIFAALCALFVFNSFATQSCMDAVSDEMHKVTVRLENGGDGAAEAFEAAAKQWEAQKKKIRCICHHDHIEQIDRAIFAAGKYLEQNEYSKVLFKAEEVCFLAEDLSRHEKITLDNIF